MYYIVYPFRNIHLHLYVDTADKCQQIFIFDTCHKYYFVVASVLRLLVVINVAFVDVIATDVISADVLAAADGVDADGTMSDVGVAVDLAAVASVVILTDDCLVLLVNRKKIILR